MNKTAIKNFAVWARNKLIAEIKYKAGLLGINENSIAPELPASTDNLKFYEIGTKEPAKVEGIAIRQRKSLVDAINNKATELKYKEAFEYVVEEVAYTWFNRLIAIRFMEVNGYLPSGVRVLSSEMSGKNEPDMVSSPFETDMEFSSAEREFMNNLKDDELFRFLFIKQCNKLNDVLPELFEKTDNYNYTELLLTLSFTDTDSVVYHLVHEIEEADFKEQVQIIGWMYQYYNTEAKDKVFADLKKNIKISSENIPVATQLFTPDWIVRYMIENSLGRLWSEGHQNFDKSEWKYYLDEAEQEDSVKAQLEEIRAAYKSISPEDIKLIDPCMGSGHILVYAFDVLMQIYLSQGYTERDAAVKIIENNILGADIDKRAYQLSYFALMMKGRASDRRFLTRGVKPNLCNFQELDVLNTANLNGILADFTKQFINADTYGSLLEVKKFDIDELAALIDEFEEDIFTYGYREILSKMLTAYKILSQKYDVVCTNPPYMGGSGMNAKLSDFVKNKYPDSKSDLFAVFIERCGEMTKPNRYYAMITQHAFMFLSSYEKLRAKLHSKTTINMAHLGARAFDEIGGEVVQTTAFVNCNLYIKNYTGSYVRLVDINGENEKKEKFLSGENRHTAKQENFSKIPGSPVAYWVSEKFIRAFENKKVIDFADCCTGMQTGNNDKYVKFWFEPNYIDTAIYNKQNKYKLYNCGGEYQKWYGNHNNVVLWGEEGRQIKNEKGSVIRNEKHFFEEGISWKRIGSSGIGLRFLPEGFIFDQAGDSMFLHNKNRLVYLLGFFNTIVCKMCFEVIAPTMNLTAGNMNKLPVIIDETQKPRIEALVEENISISKTDWDSFETSWDFEKHPFLLYMQSEVTYIKNRENIDELKQHFLIECSYDFWNASCTGRFNTLKQNEEELNRIFIDIYGLQDELTPEVEDKDVTVRKADLTRDIKSFVSYAVGCMFGRYSLDVSGLAYAGGEWDNSKYITYIPDDDNCIPITDEEYFEDDIVGRFVEFVKTVYGTETLEENLDFIANALGNKGNTSRQIIRNYFLTDFIKDHNKIYQKRPIYWMFDSGKQNGFKAIVYMHRWNADTTGNVRVEYLHKLQRVYESEINRMQEAIENGTNSRDITLAEKRKDKLLKQLKEARDYDEKISHLALARIDIDLDDGVKVNYEKVQTAQDGKKLEVLVPIK